MTLTVDPPAPPTLAAVDPNEYEDAEVVGDADYRRDELEAFLREGAWEEAFEEWAATSDMDETDWRIVEDLELVSRYDFFWDNNRMTRWLFPESISATRHIIA